MIERVDRLKAPPVVGQFYLVPTVRGRWYDYVRDWPVIGIKHNDIEHFNFAAQHYHLDSRFCVAPSRYSLTAAPLHGHADFPLLGKPVFRRRKCIREQHIFDGPHRIMTPFRNAFAGKQCGKGKRGWVCPHRAFALGSTPAIDGVITCPLHGLRIDAETGIVRTA